MHGSHDSIDLVPHDLHPALYRDRLLACLRRKCYCYQCPIQIHCFGALRQMIRCC